MKPLTIKFLRTRLAHIIAPAMGWSVRAEGERSKLGQVWIEKVYGGRYRLVQQTSEGGGERNISEALKKAELLIFMDGVLYAAEVLNARAGGVV